MMLVQDIEALIPANAVLIGQAFATAPDVIRALSAALLASGRVRATHAQAAVAREATHPTGLPTMGSFCVAIPHADAEHVLAPSIAIATLAEAVAFQNMEDPDEALPVRLVFMLAFNDKNQQIEALQMVAGMLQSPEVLEAILAAPDAASIMRIIQSTSGA
jgi:PTS system galactitol-specific IIA component